LKVLKLIVLGVVVLGIKLLSPHLSTIGDPELKTQGIIKSQALVSSTDDPGIVQVLIGDTILEVENPNSFVTDGIAEVTIEKSPNRAILKKMVPLQATDKDTCLLGEGSKTIYLQNETTPSFTGVTPDGKECIGEI